MKILAFINLAGVLALAVLCVSQWQTNRQLNLEINRLESIRIDQVESMAEQATSLAGQREDLEFLRNNILQLTEQLNTTKAALEVSKQTGLQRTSELEQVKANLATWQAAVEQRDARISENQDQIADLALRLNDTVQRYNELATNYNQSVELLNERTVSYNELVQKYNQLANPR